LLAAVVVMGLVAQWLLGAWWIDSVTSLAIGGFLVKEGLETWFGENADDEVGR
jgi:divalent metal cation (Fe/Co/Zn/Cd) transporter